ncbi:MAG: dipeptidase [Pirellulales bacterium]
MTNGQILQLLLVVVFTCFSCFQLASAERPADSQSKRAPIVMTDAARRIHRQALVIDGHNDLPWELRKQGSLAFDRLDISQPQKKLHTDIPRLRQGGVGTQFWSVYVPASTARTGTALTMTLEQIEMVQAMIEHYPDTFELARTAADIERIHRAGKIASLIGVEGGHAIENSLGVLRQLEKLGARYMTLTHSDTLDWADSATDEAKHGGLSPFGEQVVGEMNRLGMLVDLSHVSPATMKDALQISRAPVIFSHSSALALADHPRNVPDEVLRLVAQNNGLVMVNFYSGFVVSDSAQRELQHSVYRKQLKAESATEQQQKSRMRKWENEHPMQPGSIHDVLDHIDHIVATAGIDHVGLGSDYDGVSVLPAQLEDVSCYPRITQGLLDRGYNKDQILKVLGLNLIRVLKEAEKVAAGLQ